MNNKIVSGMLIQSKFWFYLLIVFSLLNNNIININNEIINNRKYFE